MCIKSLEYFILSNGNQWAIQQVADFQIWNKNPWPVTMGMGFRQVEIPVPVPVPAPKTHAKPACLPLPVHITIHTTGEYNLFSCLLESGLYFVISNKAPAAANMARLVDFNKLTIKWNETVDERATMIPNQTKAERIYYKLPEQLQCHHKLWVQARGTRATLVNTTKARSGITRILSDPACLSCSACNYASGRCYRNYKNCHSISSKEFQRQFYIWHSYVWFTISSWLSCSWFLTSSSWKKEVWKTMCILQRS